MSKASSRGRLPFARRAILTGASARCNLPQRRARSDRRRRAAVRAAGLQALMDVVLHPQFAQNKWIYLYHKPVGTQFYAGVGGGAGSATSSRAARGRRR
jgi:glucose/arabinose dehydrogenase